MNFTKKNVGAKEKINKLSAMFAFEKGLNGMMKGTKS